MKIIFIKKTKKRNIFLFIKKLKIFS